MTTTRIEEIKNDGAHAALLEAFKGKVQHVKNVMDTAKVMKSGNYLQYGANALFEATELLEEAKALFLELKKMNLNHD